MPPATPIPMPMSPETVLRITDHAASMSDRWLFVAMLVIYLGTIYLLARFFIFQLNQRDKKIENMEVHLDNLQKEFRLYLTQTAVEQAKVIQHNSEVITESIVLSEKKMAVLETIQKQLPISLSEQAKRAIGG